MRNVISLIVAGALVGVWYFIKKKPNPLFRNISIAVSLVGFLVLGIFFSDDNSQTQPVQQVVVAPSESIPSSSSISIQSTSESTEPSTTTPDISESTSSEDNTALTEDSIKKFGDYLQQRLNEMFSASGYSLGVSTHSTNLIYIYIPQDYKYETKDEIQKVADLILEEKNDSFLVWANENNLKASDNNLPRIHIKTDGDHTSLAKEKMLSEQMKVTK